jgi:hypothetical protein
MNLHLHLTHEQLCDLLLADSSQQPEDQSGVVQDHLRACLICSAELKNLRDSLSRFRDASISYASQQSAQLSARRSSIAPPQHYLTQPLYWAAAAAIVVAAIFPLSMNRQRAAAPIAAQTTFAAGQAGQTTQARQTRESDEALLEDIDQELSADVPSPMEPLADPTAGASVAKSTSDQRKN